MSPLWPGMQNKDLLLLQVQTSKSLDDANNGRQPTRRQKLTLFVTFLTILGRGFQMGGGTGRREATFKPASVTLERRQLLLLCFMQLKSTAIRLLLPTCCSCRHANPLIDTRRRSSGDCEVDCSFKVVLFVFSPEIYLVDFGGVFLTS